MILRRFYGGALLALTHPDRGNEVLLGCEREIATAFEGERLRQFCSARDLARRLLVMLGGERVPIPRCETGAPIWPQGFIGSISHSGPWVGALLGQSTDWYGLGLDIEQLGRITPKLWPILFTSSEKRQLQQVRGAKQDFLATAFFAIKEAFLKLPSPRSKQVVDYRDVEVFWHEQHFVLRGHYIDMRQHFGLNTLQAEVIIHQQHLVANILLE